MRETSKETRRATRRETRKRDKEEQAKWQKDCKARLQKNAKTGRPPNALAPGRRPGPGPGPGPAPGPSLGPGPGPGPGSGLGRPQNLPEGLVTNLGYIAPVRDCIAQPCPTEHVHTVRLTRPHVFVFPLGPRSTTSLQLGARDPSLAPRPPWSLVGAALCRFRAKLANPGAKLDGDS